MRSAASVLLGNMTLVLLQHHAERERRRDPVKEIWKFDIQSKRKELQFVVEGSGFLYKMVRSMVGGLIRSGAGED